LAYYVLTEDIDCTVTKNWNNGKGFEPIGTKDKWFEGNLNGKGYTISNLYINRPSEDFIGLFGRVAGAQISNLFLTNVEVYGNNSVGGLIGASSYYRNGDQEGVVSECHVKGKIKGEGKYVGSLIGYNYDTLVSNCFSEGEVRGEDLVGGLIGDNQYSDVKDSSSKATVKSNILKNEKSRAGGLVGHNGPEGVISNSKSEGKVNGGFLISLLTKKLFSIIVLTILLLPLITTWKKISYSKKGASIGLIIGTTVYLPNLIKYFIFNERDILLTGFVTPNFRNYLNIFYGLFKINIVFLYILVSVIIIFCLAIIGVIIGRRIEKSKETKNYNFTN